MANSKKQDPKKASERKHEPKAGPYSKSGGRNRHADRRAATREMATRKDLFAGMSDDRRQRIAAQREEREAAKAQRDLAFREQQAEIALDKLTSSDNKRKPFGLRLELATNIIAMFASVTVPEGMGRERAAFNAVRDALTDEQLGDDETLVQLEAARKAASWALREGFTTAKAAQQETASVTTPEQPAVEVAPAEELVEA